MVLLFSSNLFTSCFLRETSSYPFLQVGSVGKQVKRLTLLIPDLLEGTWYSEVSSSPAGEATGFASFTEATTTDLLYLLKITGSSICVDLTCADSFLPASDPSARPCGAACEAASRHGRGRRMVMFTQQPQDQEVWLERWRDRKLLAGRADAEIVRLSARDLLRSKRRKDCGTLASAHNQTIRSGA